MMNKKIAIPVDQDGILDEHFGHCKFLALYTIVDSQIRTVEQLIPPPHEPGLLPKWLSEKGATDIIAGGMGQKAIRLFNQNGINALVGAPRASGQELTEKFLNNTLVLRANYCDH